MSSFRSRSGGRLNRDDVQPVEQVFAELAFLHHLPQVEIRRGDDAHINLDGFHARRAA